jgi:hypothetical protein
MMAMGRKIAYGSAALAAAGALGWGLSRRRGHSAPAQQPFAGGYAADTGHIGEREVWRSVSEDIEPTLLDNPDGVLEFQREQAQTAQHTQPEQQT